MAKFFIERPVFAIVLSVMITLAGLLAAFQLPIAQYPQITPPTVNVNASYQGANADVVDSTVAQIIEQQINGVENMVSMQSTSTDAGTYSLAIQFEPGTNADMASVQTQNRVAQAIPSLPQEVQQLGVTTTKYSQDMALIFTLSSDNDAYDRKFLKNYGSIYLIEDIKRVKGVGNVREFGSDYAMRIWLQPDKIMQLGLTVPEISSAIAEQNIQAPAGTIDMQPTLPNQEFQYTARAKGRLNTKEEFENIIIRSESNGSFIRLKDVARVDLGSKDYLVYSSINGHPNAGFAVQLTSDANALQTVANVRKIIEDASKQFPPDLKYNIIIDSTRFVNESIKEVVITLGVALLLVLLVVFAFLHSWRATLIPMLAIPVSLIGTFGVFLLFGFSINTLTLFAMVLAIGLVVDDAIVVVEAVEHHMRYNGMMPMEATKRAMEEVSMPIVAIAFVLASVFIPVAFFGGTMGILYKQFALTIAFSMGLSAIVALSLTPALCAMLLKPYDPDAHGGVIGRFFEKFNYHFEELIEKYAQSLVTIVPKARSCLAFLLVVVILLVFLYRLVPTSFVPEEDQGYVITAITLPEAANMNRTEEVTERMSREIGQQAGVKDNMAVSGFDLLGGGIKPNTSVIFTGLQTWDERKTPQTQLKAEIGQIFAKGARMPEGTLMSFAPPSLPGLGMVGGFTFMLENKSGKSLQDMQQVVDKFLAEARKRPEIGMIYTTFQTKTPGYEFEVDRDKVKNLNIPLDSVFATLQTYLGGIYVDDFNLFGRTYKVVMQAEPLYRDQVKDTRFFFIKNNLGSLVPLDTLLTAKQVNAPPVISRFNGSRSMQINGSAAPGFSSGQAIAALEQVAAQAMPDSYGYEWSGQSREEKVAGSKTMIVFGLALVFVFLCLAALYESWSIPFAVLLCVPTGVFGAFLFQYMRHFENSIYMQIGLIMLIGLAAKNAILIVEFAKVRVDNGMHFLEAAVEAAKLRFRPIIMTSLAFIIGCLPLAMASGAGSAARTAMGTAVVGGMLLATALGIFLIPTLFVLIEKITARLQRLFNRNSL